MDDLTYLRTEIDAYYNGASNAGALRRAFDNAELLVPLTDDEDVYMASMGGINWLCAFSLETEMDKYRATRTDMSSGRFMTIAGWRLATAGGTPTCVVVDVKGRFPMAFPPPLKSSM